MRDKNVYELAVKKKVEGAFKWVRAAVIAGYILLTVAIIVIANITRIGAVFIVIVPMILLLIVIPATWRFVDIEYYYRIGLDNNTNKKLTMDYVHGGKGAKPILGPRGNEGDDVLLPAL